MITRLLSIGLVAGLLTFAASAQSPPDRMRVRLLSPTLERSLQVDTPVFQTVGEFTLLQARVENTTSQDIAIEYHVDWFDEAGVSVQVVSGWQPLLLSAGEEKRLRTVGQNKSAYSASIQFRYPSNR